MFLSRDLDSRLDSREASAVQEWIRTQAESDPSKIFHIMRDHYSHKVRMLGNTD